MGEIYTGENEIGNSSKTLHSGDEMKAYAARIVAYLAQQHEGKNSAAVVGLSGDLGAGKTTFSQGLAQALQVTDTVQSPTFAIMKKYDVHEALLKSTFHTLIHIDAYRLEKSTELLNLGFEDMLRDAGNLIVIEWPERVEDILPPHTTLYFEHMSENERTVTMR